MSCRASSAGDLPTSRHVHLLLERELGNQGPGFLIGDTPALRGVARPNGGRVDWGRLAVQGNLGFVGVTRAQDDGTLAQKGAAEERGNRLHLCGGGGQRSRNGDGWLQGNHSSPASAGPSFYTAIFFPPHRLLLLCRPRRSEHGIGVLHGEGLRGSADPVNPSSPSRPFLQGARVSGAAHRRLPPDAGGRLSLAKQSASPPSPCPPHVRPGR